MALQIRKLEISGYKSLKHVVWEPSDLNVNVLIGPNGSGKSNLLRLLEMLSASARGELDEFIKGEGGIEQLLYDKLVQNIKISLEVESPSDGPDNAYSLKYFLQIDSIREWHRYFIQSEFLNGGFSSAEPSKRKLLERKDHDFAFMTKDGNQGGGGNDQFETALYQVGRSSNSDAFLHYFQEYLSNFRCYHGFDTDYGSDIRRPTMTRYENILESNGNNLINYLFTKYSEDVNFREDLNSAMQAAFGTEFKEIAFGPAADQYIQMKIKWKNLLSAQPPGMLSDGILRYLFIVAALTAPHPPGLLAIDEPEIGFHPAMLPIIAELAVQASERTQVVLTTHSPEFLNAFDDATPKVTVLDWHDGETKIRNLSGENLKYWLERYKLGELFSSGGLEAID